MNTTYVRNFFEALQNSHFPTDFCFFVKAGAASAHRTQHATAAADLHHAIAGLATIENRRRFSHLHRTWWPRRPGLCWWRDTAAAATTVRSNAANLRDTDARENSSAGVRRVHVGYHRLWLVVLPHPSAGWVVGRAAGCHDGVHIFVMLVRIVSLRFCLRTAKSSHDCGAVNANYQRITAVRHHNKSEIRPLRTSTICRVKPTKRLNSHYHFSQLLCYRDQRRRRWRCTVLARCNLQGVHQYRVKKRLAELYCSGLVQKDFSPRLAKWQGPCVFIFSSAAARDYLFVKAKCCRRISRPSNGAGGTIYVSTVARLFDQTYSVNCLRKDTDLRNNLPKLECWGERRWQVATPNNRRQRALWRCSRTRAPAWKEERTTAHLPIGETVA